MLTAGMSTRAVARELNVNFSTISRLQRRFREFGSASNRPHNCRPRVATTAQHLQDRLRPATRTAAATIGLHHQRISAQTVINRLREAHLHARHPHRGLDLTAVCRRNDLSGQMLTFDGIWHIREVFSSRMNPGRADGRQRVWHRVGERFVDVNAVDRVAHGGGGVMVWAGVCYGQRKQVNFIDGILNAQRYRDEILSPIVVPFIHDHHLMLQHDPANIQQLHTAIEEERTNIPQATINNLINSQSTTPPQYSKTAHFRVAFYWPFIVASPRHTCAIIMLSN